MFEMSYDHKLSCRMGNLVPIHLQECLPSDKFNISSEALVRLAPMLAPVMHKVDLYIHYFFVPNRIVWANWEKFIAPETDDAIPPAFPYLNLDDIDTGKVTVGSLSDYLGLPTDVLLGPSSGSTGRKISAIPHAGYQKIYNEFYRDQNLIPEIDCDLPDGDIGSVMTTDLMTIRRRAWEHDYFTSCLPEPQKGPEVLLPITLSGQLPVELESALGQSNILLDSTTGVPANGPMIADPSSGEIGTAADPIGVIDPNKAWYVDLAQGDDSTVTVNDLRTASAIQRWLERASRVGTRYIEVLKGFFDVNSSDKRLQRPEYIGGAKTTVAMSEVLQTSSTDTETPQGNMAGHGIGVAQGQNISYYCEEHGYLFGIMSVLPKTAYFQGMPKHFEKTKDKYQYFWDDLANIGEEPVYNRELLYKNDNTGPGKTYNDTVFGYLPRYTDYRYNIGRVSGTMKTSLDFWHMAREWNPTTDSPTLNADFISANPTKRIFAVEDPNVEDLYVHIYHNISARRPLPKYGTPGSII